LEPNPGNSSSSSGLRAQAASEPLVQSQKFIFGVSGGGVGLLLLAALLLLLLAARRHRQHFVKAPAAPPDLERLL